MSVNKNKRVCTSRFTTVLTIHLVNPTYNPMTLTKEDIQDNYSSVGFFVSFLFLFFFLCVHLQFQTNMKNWIIYHSIEYLKLKSDILSHWIADRWIPQIQQGLFYTLPFTCKFTVNVGKERNTTIKYMSSIFAVWPFNLFIATIKQQPHMPYMT